MKGVVESWCDHECNQGGKSEAFEVKHVVQILMLVMLDVYTLWISLRVDDGLVLRTV